MVLYTIELNEKFLVAIILSLIPIGVDGIGQLFGFWEEYKSSFGLLLVFLLGWSVEWRLELLSMK